MSPLPGIAELVQRQRAYYEIVSTWERRPWGVLGVNSENPQSHDSNHGYLEARLAADALPAVLGEVSACYLARHTEPRLRFHIPPNTPELTERGQAMGWNAEQMDETWRAWPVERDHEEPAAVAGMTVSLVGREALEEILAVDSEGVDEATAFRKRGVWSALGSDDATQFLLARLDGEPAAGLACIWRDNWGAIENVRTREPFRRRGICSAMIRFMQGHAAGRGGAGLYLYDSEEGPDRIYARAGFELVGRRRQVTLWQAAPERRGC
jgi:hypothetical protein